MTLTVSVGKLANSYAQGDVINVYLQSAGNGIGKTLIGTATVTGAPSGSIAVTLASALEASLRGNANVIAARAWATADEVMISCLHALGNGDYQLSIPKAGSEICVLSVYSSTTIDKTMIHNGMAAGAKAARAVTA